LYTYSWFVRGFSIILHELVVEGLSLKCDTWLDHNLTESRLEGGGVNRRNLKIINFQHALRPGLR
jgi:hypothetical protein